MIINSKACRQTKQHKPNGWGVQKFKFCLNLRYDRSNLESSMCRLACFWFATCGVVLQVVLVPGTSPYQLLFNVNAIWFHTTVRILKLSLGLTNMQVEKKNNQKKKTLSADTILARLNHTYHQRSSPTIPIPNHAKEIKPKTVTHPSYLINFSLSNKKIKKKQIT